MNRPDDEAPAVEGVRDGFYDALLEDDPVELYERAPCAYLSTLPDGTVVKVNGTFEDWTGYAREALVGRRRFRDLLAPGGRIYHETHVAPLLRMQGTVREIATEVLCADGSRLPVILNAVLQRDAGGDAGVVRIALFDATERRSYEQELVRARRRAEAAEQRARQLAETLQASLLPPEVLEVHGLDIAGAYRPAGDGFEVGGDFYDVFETGRGTWAVVLGDVSGKGAAAALVTTLARHTVRAEAMRTPYPSAVLAGLHEAMRRNHPDRFCTALLLLLDRFDGAFRLHLSSGGHHLPLLLRDGTVRRLGRTGTILGMLDRVDVTDDIVTLAPGDVVVLHTDGVTEARRDGRFLDDVGLDEIVAGAAPGDAQALADLVVTTAVDYQDGTPADDIAVVVLRIP